MSDNMIFVDFGWFTIYWYGMFMGVNVFLTALGFSYLRKQQGESFYSGLTAALISMPAALVVSRIFYCWFSKASFTNGITDFIDLMSGGYALYGALLGVLIVLLIYSAANKKSALQMLDAAVVAISLSIIIGRFAGIASGSDIGFSISNESFQRFPLSVWSESEQSWYLWVGLFEGIAAVIIFIFTLVMFLMKYKFKKKGLSCGDITLLFMLTYGLSQTVLESMRNDSLFMVSLGFVRINQIISIVLAVISFVIIIIKCGLTKKPTVINVILWLICIAALALAVCCEFKMNATTMVMSYFVMSVSLLIILIIALYMFFANVKMKICEKQSQIQTVVD